MKFSVVIPLYNKENYIKAAIQSVLAQSFQDYEIIIVDDGSTDQSAKRVWEITSERLLFLRQENLGVSVARNTGILHAKGEYVSFLDADDEWEPDYLETVDELTRKYEKSDIFVTAYKIRLGERYVASTILKEPDGLIDSYWKTLTCKYDFVWTSATTIRKTALHQAGLFHPGEKSGQDLDLWARIARNNPRVACSAKRCAVYNRMAENNCRERMKIAYPSAFIKDLEKELASGNLDRGELRAVKHKYALKMTAYAYTCIMYGRKREAKRVLQRWRKNAGSNGFFLRGSMRVAMALPEIFVKWVYGVRLKVF